MYHYNVKKKGNLVYTGTLKETGYFPFILTVNNKDPSLEISREGRRY